MECTFTQVFHVKLIRFTLADTVLIIVKISEPFLFTACISVLLIYVLLKYLLIFSSYGIVCKCCSLYTFSNLNFMLSSFVASRSYCCVQHNL
jgi:hypothetical protein